MNRTTTVDRGLAAAALVLGIASAAIGDADKTPLYLLLAYALWRLR